MNENKEERGKLAYTIIRHENEQTLFNKIFDEIADILPLVIKIGFVILLSPLFFGSVLLSINLIYQIVELFK